jgi:tRNA (guanine37-N1)-methyltransferase
MVMKAEPIVSAVESVLGKELVSRQKAAGEIEVPVVLLTPAGQLFSQDQARAFERHGRLALLCGRYEGVDERVSDLVATHEVSIGDYVLSGGEIPAMVVVEAVARLVPGVLGDMRALVDDSHTTGLLEHPHYTRPAEYRGLRVPEVLLSGDHARVARWRRERSLARTLSRRPDLLDTADLSQEDLACVAGLIEQP